MVIPGCIDTPHVIPFFLYLVIVVVNIKAWAGPRGTVGQRR